VGFDEMGLFCVISWWFELVLLAFVSLAWTKGAQSGWHLAFGLACYKMTATQG